MGDEKKVNPDQIIPSSVKLKDVKLAYYYIITYSKYLLLTLLLVTISLHLSTYTTEDLFILLNHLKQNLVLVIVCSTTLFLLAVIYIQKRPRNVYLVNFACYKPSDSLMCPIESYLGRASQIFNEEHVAFQKKIIERSGLGPKTYFPEAFFRESADPSFTDARKEVEMLAFGAIDELLAKTGVNAKDIGVLVVSSGIFCPTPSVSAMVVNHYKLRSNILSYNITGMGCSAGIISINLVRQLFQLHSNCYALVVCLDSTTQGWYIGSNRSMLVPNCIFRMGSAAILLSNRSSDRHRSKYKLVQIVGTHRGSDDKSYGAVSQGEDEDKRIGTTLSKDIMSVAGEALKTNISTLGPLVLPLSEQLLFFGSLIAKKVFKMKIKSYIPDFKLAFEHFCIHAGGKAVLDAIKKNLELTEWHMEPSRMTLYRFGNTSASSLWYNMAYTEGKGRVKRGNRIWLIGFGSGFKSYSAVWQALKNVDPAKEMNPWMDEINEFPVHVS
ncbi:hypothetical protein LguiA_001276 [Lonicera macranthoides]